jgi:tetratricopeptide (TPR) repeat protein
MSVKSIKLKSPVHRAALIAAALVCLTGAFFFAKWCFANTLTTQSSQKELTEFAAGVAPSDPQAHYALGVLYEKSFLAEDLPKSLAEFEKAAALSPNDFRLWLALGKARERVGDASGAENALRKALELAPNYSEIQWTLGNVLLRAGKTGEAFAEIRKATVSDPKYVNPAISTAWQISGGSVAEIKQNLGDSAQINSALAVYLAKQKRFDEAMQAWNALADNDKKTTFKQNGDELYKALTEAKKYRAALEIQRQTTESGNIGYAFGKITNGGFEEAIAAGQNLFNWQIADGAKPQIGVDNQQKHGGNLSLLIIFNSGDGKDFRDVSQTIVVEPGKKYSFEMFYKSSLKTSATLKWEFVDASDGKLLAATEAISANADWTSVKTEFNAPENTEAVTLRLARDVCKTGICPISGSILFDDFSISDK